MNMSEHQSLIAVFVLLGLFVFSRQILRLCLGVFVSVSSIMLAVISVVVCALLIFVVAGPTVVLTCYVVGQASEGKQIHSPLVNKLCASDSTKHHSQKY